MDTKRTELLTRFIDHTVGLMELAGGSEEFDQELEAQILANFKAIKGEAPYKDPSK